MALRPCGSQQRAGRKYLKQATQQKITTINRVCWKANHVFFWRRISRLDAFYSWLVHFKQIRHFLIINLQCLCVYVFYYRTAHNQHHQLAISHSRLFGIRPLSAADHRREAGQLPTQGQDIGRAVQTIWILTFYLFIIVVNNFGMSSSQQKESSNRIQRVEYTKTNAYTQSSSVEQILTVALFVIEVALHSVFVTSAIARQDSPILWIMLAATYVLLAIIVVDYVFLTCSDPVDDLLLGIDKGYKSGETKYCKDGCAILVHVSSYHCHTCNRCVEKFDHHCKYLNNCIGGKNYHSFFRLLVMVTAFCVLISGSAIWIFVFSDRDHSFNSKILSKWGVIATLAFTVMMMVSVDTLLCFHCYLVLKVKKSTLDYLDPRPHDNVDSSKQVISG